MSEKPSFTNRQTSLSYFKEKNIHDVPSFLKDSYNHHGHADYNRTIDNNVNVVRMKVSTLIGFLALVTILGILLFGAGYMLAFSMYATQTQAPIDQNQATATTSQSAEALIVAPESPPAPVRNFAVEFGSADNVGAANDMVQQLTKQNLTTKIEEVKDLRGKASYKIQSQTFASYQEAYAFLQTVPQPFATWGKVVDLNANNSESNNAAK